MLEERIRLLVESHASQLESLATGYSSKIEQLIVQYEECLKAQDIKDDDLVSQVNHRMQSIEAQNDIEYGLLAQKLESLESEYARKSVVLRDAQDVSLEEIKAKNRAELTRMDEAHGRAVEDYKTRIASLEALVDANREGTLQLAISRGLCNPPPTLSHAGHPRHSVSPAHM